MILITKTSDQTRQRGHVCVCVYLLNCVCVCVLSSHLFWTSGFFDVPVGVTQEKGHTGFLRLPSAVLALTLLARRIQPFLSLVDREVEFCALTN